jgi:hypothetical protein
MVENLDEKTRALFLAINEKNDTHAGAAKHLNYIDQWMKRQKNEAIETKAKEYLYTLKPIKITKKALQTMDFVAKAVSRYLRTPTELSGICAGEDEEEIIIDDFFPYLEQICNSVETKATGFGKLVTNRKIKKKGRKAICSAHSHNIMSCFHSKTDDGLLKQNIKDSPRLAQIEYCFAGVKRVATIPYSYNVVFNERIRKNPKEIYVKCGIEIPTTTGEKKIYMRRLSSNIIDSELQTLERLKEIYREIIAGVDSQPF